MIDPSIRDRAVAAYDLFTHEHLDRRRLLREMTLLAGSAAAAEALPGVAAATMLTPGIHRAYCAGVAALEGNPAVTRVAQGQPGTAHQGQPALFAITGAAFLADHRLAEEVFGAASLVLRLWVSDRRGRHQRRRQGR